MTPVCMPFTYLPESTARALAALVGPVVVYQPLAPGATDNLSTLASQGIIRIRTPLTGDEDRLKAALAEFTEWARMNPGKSSPGAGFISSRQGDIPFFDESSISRIRSDIQHYGGQPAKAEWQETVFSARLFLAVAQDNDRATDHLDHDLERFKKMEQGFVDLLAGADEADFSRHSLGAEIWREDPGAKLTEQRIRAWATIAAADDDSPDLFVTTSPAVIDTLVDVWGESIDLQKLAAIRLPIPPTADAIRLQPVLTDLLRTQSLAPAAMAAFSDLDDHGGDAPSVAATLYAAENRSPRDVIGRLAPSAIAPPEKKGSGQSLRHALILLVES